MIFLIKVLTIFGTRPEAIKMAPLALALNKQKEIKNITVVTAQHREMLDQVLNIFNIVPDYDLNIMKLNQSIEDITINILKEMTKVIINENPDLVLVHGDTTTAFASALSAFYNQVKIGHVEAGLRSFNLKLPFPEEANRKLIDSISNFYFAPTIENVENLIKENVDSRKIFLTGNTVIDALKYISNKEYDFKNQVLKTLDLNKKIILVTCHRRENLGDPMKNIFSAINTIANKYQECEIIFPIHKNPKIREIQKSIIEVNEQIHIIEPLDYLDFIKLMKHCYLILTDSGGIQEEAPFFGVPCIVLRTVTERIEAVKAGTVKLAGTEYCNIVNCVSQLIDEETEYNKMANAKNPYGDGNSVDKIISNIIREFNTNSL